MRNHSSKCTERHCGVSTALPARCLSGILMQRARRFKMIALQGGVSTAVPARCLTGILMRRACRCCPMTLRARCLRGIPVQTTRLQNQHRGALQSDYGVASAKSMRHVESCRGDLGAQQNRAASMLSAADAAGELRAASHTRCRRCTARRKQKAARASSASTAARRSCDAWRGAMMVPSPPGLQY